MILNHLPISAYSGVLKFDMKIFVNVARLEIGQLFTQGTRWGHPYTLDTFLVKSNYLDQIQSLLSRRLISAICYTILLIKFFTWIQSILSAFRAVNILSTD